MAGQEKQTWEEIKRQNAAFQRKKHLKEAVKAWGFLLPNFLGFMIVTFFPIFFTFFVSFTKYDGFSLNKTKAKLDVQFQLNHVMKEGDSVNYLASTKARADITIPKGTVLTRSYQEMEQWDKDVQIPFVTKFDIVIPADVEKKGFYTNRTYYLFNKGMLGQWYDETFFVANEKGEKEQYLSPDVSKMSKDLAPYIDSIKKHSKADNRVFTPSANSAIDIKFKGKAPEGVRKIVISDKIVWRVPVISSRTNDAGEISISTNIRKVTGREIGFRLSKKSIGKRMVIPKGTVIYANLQVKARRYMKPRTYNFVLKEEVKIKSGKKVSGVVKVEATEGGIVSKNPSVDLIAGSIKSGKVQLKQSAISLKKATDKKIISDYTTVLASVNPGAHEKFTKPGKNYHVTPFVTKVTSGGGDGLVMVGFENYRKILFNDDRFADYLFNTVFFLVLQIPIGMAISLLLAMAMNQPLKGIVVYRVLFFLPVISNIVAVALLWQVLLQDTGVINMALRAIGISNPPIWFGNKWAARFAIVIVEVWKGAGYNMMLYLAGLQGIPQFLYEAADIDGANGWQQFWAITWPLLSPTNFFILIMGIIGGFQAFGTQFVLTGGGPAGSTTTIVYYIYVKAYKAFEMGYATALAVILFVFVMIFTLINWKVSEGNVEY